MQILVTGGNGFIGSHLTERLLAAGNQVSVVDDLSTGRKSNLDHVVGHPGLRLIHADLGDPNLVREVCETVDVVYHLAAAVGVALIAKHPIQTIHRNIYPTQLLLEELRRIHMSGRQVSMFLASTSEVYGKNPKRIWCEEDDLVFGATTKPRWSYGASKAIDEFLALACVRECQMNIVTTRHRADKTERRGVRQGEAGTGNKRRAARQEAPREEQINPVDECPRQERPMDLPSPLRQNAVRALL